LSVESRDLQLAKKLLVDHVVTLAAAHDGKVVFESGLRGVSGFLDMVEVLGDGLRGASVADKVVGKAVALLCVFAGVKSIYAVTLGLTAKRVFDDNGVYCEWEGLVENILNAGRTGVCEFEQAVADVSDGEVALVRLTQLRGELAKGLMR